jgi:IclR family acetate operon transcriptional repressor
MTSSAGSGPAGVLVLHKTLDILEQIKAAECGYRLAELARAVDLPKATVYRILATLEGRGYLDRGPDGTYRMARKLFEMQQTVPLEQLLTRVAEPVMEKLATFSQETVNLGILDGGEVVVINTVESPQAVRLSSKIGTRRCAHATSLGKVLLAGMLDQEVSRLVRLKGLPRMTGRTLTSRTALMAELHNVRQQGWALDDRENEVEGRCVATPIVGPDARVVAALSVSGPIFRMELARARALVPEMKSACAAISRALRAQGKNYLAPKN